MTEHPDVLRLREEYAERARHMDMADRYMLFNQPHLFMFQQRQRAILSTLKKNKFTDLSNKLILEMGCGGGGVLTEYLGFGALPEKMYGVDLLFDRLHHAHHILSGSGFANADGQALPFPAQTFDLVLQSTAISSILDEELRTTICADMLRVLRRPDPVSGKPGGMILSYDFWLNPTNPQTRGVTPPEIKQLFPKCSYQFQRITLAPPITRKLAPISWGLCLLLENLKIFNTHYLVAIRPY